MKRLIVGLLALVSMHAWSSPLLIDDNDDIVNIGTNTLSFKVLKDIHILPNSFSKRISKNCRLNMKYALGYQAVISKDKVIRISTTAREKIINTQFDEYFHIGNYEKAINIQCEGNGGQFSIGELKEELKDVLSVSIEERYIELD